MTTEELSNECEFCREERIAGDKLPRQLVLLGRTEKKGLKVLVCPMCDLNQSDED